MKILLIALNAKYIHSNLAVYSLMSYTKQYEDSIGLVELTINHSEEDILKLIYQERAEVVAFSCYIWNIGIIKRISRELKKLQPKVKLWFGGPEVSYDVQKCLQENEQLDGIMIGEGEQTFLELVEYYVDGTGELTDIAGLAFKASARDGDFTIERNMPGDLPNLPEEAHNTGEFITVTKKRQLISMDMIPFPYQNIEVFKNRIIYYESIRGCPFSCSYCLSSVDKRVRFRSPDLVKKELKDLLEYQVPQIKFVDRTFNCNKKHAMEIWQFIKENDNGITNFHFEISADLLEDNEIEFLATLRPGQVQLEIGVQTTNPDTIAVIRRKMDFQRLARNVARIKKGSNIHQHLDLIAGLPCESYSSFEKSFSDVYLLKPDQLQLGFLKVLKGSFLQEESSRYEIVYRNTPPYEVLCTAALSYDELIKIKGVCEMLEIYYNSGQFNYSVSYLEHFFKSPMKLYQAISDFYEATGNSLLSPSRIRRYEILLDFFEAEVIESYGAKERLTMTALFKELLVLDLYLREDMKSRPCFTPISPKQHNLREVYEKYGKDRKKVHIEAFTFDVISSAETGKTVRKTTTILFDYDHRDPLNKAAEITILED